MDQTVFRQHHSIDIDINISTPANSVHSSLLHVCDRMALINSPPFNGVYILVALSYELARLPLFLVKFLTRHGRQHPEWSYRQSIMTHIMFSFVYHLAKIQARTPTPLTPGSEKERFVRIQPAGSDAYTGPLRVNSDIQPVEIGASWYPAPLSAASDKSSVRVVLVNQGGGFVIGVGRTTATGYAAKQLLRHTPSTHVLAPQYRVSTLPVDRASNPFPAALQDALTAYLYLVQDLKIAPNNIVLSGDSAGGNLAIALLRYITEHGAALSIPNPGAGLLWSPWIDPSDDSDSLCSNPNYATDYLSHPFTVWGVNAYRGQGGTKNLESPYAVHKMTTFSTSVPLFVNTGSGEVLYFDDVEWAEEMLEAGNDVTLDVEKNVPHDILLVGNILGFDKEAQACAKRAGDWLRTKGI
jgi:acetyl esterase/lipase